MPGSLCKSSFCCCGCPLKEGTLTLFYITAFFWSIICILCFSSSKVVSLVLLVCFILPKVAGIYGIYQKIPMLLIPQMVTQWILIVFWSCFLLVIIFMRKQTISFFREISGADSTGSFFFTPIIFLLLCIGIQYHLFAVVNGYFSEMSTRRNVPQPVQMATVNNFSRWMQSR